MRKIDAMHHYYGYGCGICGECPHFQDKGWYDKHYFKCRVYGSSNAESTDWRKGYTACGLIDKPFPADERRIVDRIVASRAEEKPIPGQMMMEFDC